MNAILIDTRGRSCPEPVLLVKKALTDPGAGYEIQVDNPTALQNIRRFLSSNGWRWEESAQNDETVLSVKK